MSQPTNLALPGRSLAETLWPAEGSTALFRNVLLAVFGSLLLWASAKVQVPFWPVPMTMQTYVVLAIGMAYGMRLGTATVLFYLLQGAAGLPVFANTPERGLGLAYLAGPTGGFLIGFLAAAALAGWLADRGWDRDWPKALVTMLVGHAVIFVFGVTWLTGGLGLGFTQAVAVGVTPFLLGTVLKTGLGMATLPLAWRAATRRG